MSLSTSFEGYFENGEPHFARRTVGDIRRHQEMMTLTCNHVTTDVITTETAPVAAEIYTMTCPANCVGVDIMLEHSAVNNVVADIPFARGALVVFGAIDIDDAVLQLAIPDNAVGSTTIVGGTRTAYLGLDDSLSTEWAMGAVLRVDVGFLAPDTSGTATIDVRLHATFRTEA